jgi:hypothetical protein
MEFRCPYCNSPIYSRQNQICGVCEKLLPKELLLTDQQIAELKKAMEQEEKELKQFKKQMNTLPKEHGGSLTGLEQ